MVTTNLSCEVRSAKGRNDRPVLRDGGWPSALGAWTTQSNARAWQHSAVTSLV